VESNEKFEQGEPSFHHIAHAASKPKVDENTNFYILLKNQGEKG